MDSYSRSGKRKPNFTESENMYLVQEFEKHKTILNSRVTSMETNRGKQNIWEEICIGLNALNNNEGKEERTVKEIRRKWKNMVTSAKRQAKQLKVTSKDPSGRSVKPLSALSQKIIEMKTPESSKVEQSSPDNDTVIVEIKTEQQESGYCTEFISKKGPLKVFYSNVEPGKVPPSDQRYGLETRSPSSSDEASFCEIPAHKRHKHDGIACEIESHETDDDEIVEEKSTPDKSRKRGGVASDSAHLRKHSKTHSSTMCLQNEISELKRDKLLLQIEKLKSEKDKLGMEKERLGLEIEFWKKKLSNVNT